MTYRLARGLQVGRGRLRERLKQLLREPDNLFGPPTGRGYDYGRAGLTTATMGLAVLSIWCRLTVETAPGYHLVPSALVRWTASPAYVCGSFFWPFHLYVAAVAAAVLW